MSTTVAITNGHDAHPHHQHVDVIDDSIVAEMQSSTPFEGPEKLLEIWFAPSADRLPVVDAAKYGSGDGDGDGDGDENDFIKRKGLRKIHRAVWEEMLDVVKCKVLSVIVGEETDAYLLRWASRDTHCIG